MSGLGTRLLLNKVVTPLHSETVEYPNTLELYDAGWKCFYQFCFFSRVLSGSLSVQVSLEVGSERFSRPLAFEVMPKLQY